MGSRKVAFALHGLLLLAVLLAIAAVPRVGLWLQSGGGYGLALDYALPALTLRDARSANVSLERYRGRPIFVYFGYLRCQTVCPLSTRTLQLLSEMPAAENADFVYINLNPAEHSPATLRAYEEHFQNRIDFLYGSPTELAAAARAFRTSYFVPPANPAAFAASGSAADEIDHSDAIYLVDAEMRMRFLYLNSRRDVAAMAGDLRMLAREAAAIAQPRM